MSRITKKFLKTRINHLNTRYEKQLDNKYKFELDEEYGGVRLDLVELSTRCHHKLSGCHSNRELDIFLDGFSAGRGIEEKIRLLTGRV